jgi:proteasome lid subunit RPN8/RPN11
MANSITVTFTAELLDAIFEGARRLYPKETILLLRGKKPKTQSALRSWLFRL